MSTDRRIMYTRLAMCAAIALSSALVAHRACSASPAAGAAASRFATSPCITQTSSAAADACARLAQDVSHNIDSIRELGRELEKLGRYREAVETYRIGLTAHPNHRDLLQGLIHARGQARSMSLLAEPKPLSTSPLVGEVARSAGEGASPAPLQGATPSSSPANAPKSKLPTDLAATPRPELKAATPPPRVTETVEATTAGRYYALIIGNEQYKDFTSLKTPLADAHAMAAVLGRDYGFIVRVLANATRYQIVSALSQIRQQATAQDSVLIYYAGHGYLDETTSRGYWLPVDAEHNNLANWLSTSDITDLLAGLQAKHALVLADSCFSGTLLRGDATVAIDERQTLLHKLSTRRSRSIMTSGGLEPVTDNGAGNHSVFAAALLRALRDNHQVLEAGRLFMQIRDHVAANAAQTPQYAPLRNAGHDGGDFIFTRTRTRTADRR